MRYGDEFHIERSNRWPRPVGTFEGRICDRLGVMTYSGRLSAPVQITSEGHRAAPSPVVTHCGGQLSEAPSPIASASQLPNAVAEAVVPSAVAVLLLMASATAASPVADAVLLVPASASAASPVAVAVLLVFALAVAICPVAVAVLLVAANAKASCPVAVASLSVVACARAPSPVAVDVLLMFANAPAPSPVAVAVLLVNARAKASSPIALACEVPSASQAAVPRSTLTSPLLAMQRLSPLPARAPPLTKPTLSASATMKADSFRHRVIDRSTCLCPFRLDAGGFADEYALPKTERQSQVGRTIFGVTAGTLEIRAGDPSLSIPSYRNLTERGRDWTQDLSEGSICAPLITAASARAAGPGSISKSDRSAHFRKMWNQNGVIREHTGGRLTVLEFRRIGWCADDYTAWSNGLMDVGTAFVVPTHIDGEAAARIVISNPRTTMADIGMVLDSMQ